MWWSWKGFQTFIRFLKKVRFVDNAMIWSKKTSNSCLRYGSSPPYYYNSARKDIGRYTFHLLFENGTVAHFVKWKGLDETPPAIFYYPRKSTLHGDQDKTFSFCTVSFNHGMLDNGDIWCKCLSIDSYSLLKYCYNPKKAYIILEQRISLNRK